MNSEIRMNKLVRRCRIEFLVHWRHEGFDICLLRADQSAVDFLHIGLDCGSFTDFQIWFIWKNLCIILF